MTRAMSNMETASLLLATPFSPVPSSNDIAGNERADVSAEEAEKLWALTSRPPMGVSDDLDMGEILGTEEGIEALAEFIETSGAFKKTGQLTLEIMEPRLEDATVEGGNEVDWEQEDGRIAEEASDDED
ncbi:hypothetical protein EV368DRAFT_79495 [Lentinula lateritia]|nr:hypothetical protein EV368DRAFT_79495 [Lentinula lateritia]